MTLTELLILLLVAAICGALGQALVGYSVGGCLVSIVVGLVGAYVGTWAATKLGLPEMFSVDVGGKHFPILWSIIGSAIFSAVLGLVNRTINSRRAIP